jgi:hypothetical protein
MKGNLDVGPVLTDRFEPARYGKCRPSPEESVRLHSAPPVSTARSPHRRPGDRQRALVYTDLESAILGSAGAGTHTAFSRFRPQLPRRYAEGSRALFIPPCSSGRGAGGRRTTKPLSSRLPGADPIHRVRGTIG